LTTRHQPATATTIAPTADLASGAVWTYDVGANNNLTVNAANVTFESATATFARAAGNTGTISLLNWPAGKTIPTGFVQNSSFLINVNFVDTPAVEPTVRVVVNYRNSGLAPITAPTPTYSNGTLTYTLSSSSSDAYQAVFLIDGYQLAAGRTTAGSTVINITAVNEINVDFGQTQPNPTQDTAFINSCTMTYDQGASLPYNNIRIESSTTVSYQTTPSIGRSAVELGKLIFRRIWENSSLGTASVRRQIALGNLPVNLFSFNGSGIQINQINGVATTGIGIMFRKDGATTATQNAVVTFSMWVVDNQGQYYALNSANGRYTSTSVQVILYEGFSPGAIANLNTSQINAIADGVSSSQAPSFNALARGIEDASLLVPTTIVIP
jgi:hypothetical protein